MRSFLFNLLIALIGGGLLTATIGCGSSEAKAVAVPLDQVPEAMVKKARETLPDVTFDHARKLKNGNYEIRGKGKTGKVREVEFNPAGEVVEIE